MIFVAIFLKLYIITFNDPTSIALIILFILYFFVFHILCTFVSVFTKSAKRNKILKIFLQRHHEISICENAETLLIIIVVETNSQVDIYFTGECVCSSEVFDCGITCK